MSKMLYLIYPDNLQVVVAGRNSVQVGKKGERAEKLFLHYSQRWAKDYLRRRLDWVVEDVYGRQDYASNTSPRHLKGALCPCQVFTKLNIIFSSPKIIAVHRGTPEK